MCRRLLELDTLHELYCVESGPVHVSYLVRDKVVDMNGRLAMLKVSKACVTNTQSIKED
jgi:hypothetical protein